MSATIEDPIASLESQIAELKKRLAAARKAKGAQEVPDYTLKRPDGSEVRLSELFGERDDLIAIHNMGRSCPYCTLWADGFLGVSKHLMSRAGFVLVSADPPDWLREFAASRAWDFPLASNEGSAFAKDMGFWQEEGEYAGPMPGVTAFWRDPQGTIYRIASASFGPGDDFCTAWHFFDLLKDGPGDWSPKYAY
jgi:predicted dithiol-disulfide oxidoreductase (DUF899 family)